MDRRPQQMHCLADSYRQRLDEVCEYPVLSGVHPICTSSEEITAEAGNAVTTPAKPVTQQSKSSSLDDLMGGKPNQQRRLFDYAPASQSCSCRQGTTSKSVRRCASAPS